MSTYLDKNLVVGPFQCNCRILACPKTGEAALIDPGAEPKRIIQALEGLKTPGGMPIQVRYLFHTHGHLDHIGATRDVKTALATAPRIALHRDDEPLYLQLKMQGQLFRMNFDEPLPVDLHFEHEQQLKVGELKFTVIHNPGHSPGSVSLRLHEDSSLGVKETVFSGDTLFQGSVGRTDLWGANGDQMFKMIHERLLTLDGDTRVCPGHGPETSIAIEKSTNPFLT
jgi:glyoxylase-like metal-dependent hydrolase (beta-lactamase superfamily II)